MTTEGPNVSAHPGVEDMDEKPLHSDRLTSAPHFKPLSMYSRVIGCKETKRKLSNPFVNFKIEIANNCAKKRKPDDSAQGDGYETPIKKAFNLETLSPDLGYCSPLDSVSPFATTVPAFFDKTQAITCSSELTEGVSSRLHSERVGCGSAEEPEDNEGTAAHSLMPEKVELNLAHAFDFDVDKIMCLKPLGLPVGFSDDKESGESPSSDTIQVLKPDVVREAKMERGGEFDKEMCANVNGVEDDKGYFSMSYLMDLKMGKSGSQSVCPPLPPATCSALLRLGEVEVPECSRKPDVQLCPVVSGPLLESDSRSVEPLEGDVEEAWNIGSPIFESSVCQPSVVEDTTVDTSYEMTLLQVQVKSVVVALGRHTTSTETKPNPDDNRGPKCVSTSRRGRPVIFDSEMERERQKRLYIHSVNRHLEERRGASQDPMSELHHLMGRVADRTSGSDGRRWQHPSDLTQRNYQRRFGNQKPKISLREWQAKHLFAYKRFATVPKIFKRSPFP